MFYQSKYPAVWLALVLALPLARGASAQNIPDLNLSEPNTIFDGSFIAPNEYENARYADHLAVKTGAYLGVGSFRGLNVAARADFSQIILFDFDPNIVEFNRVNREILKRSHSKEAYLLNLCGKEFDVPNAQRFDQPFFKRTYPKLSTSARDSVFRFCREQKNHPEKYVNFFFASDLTFKKTKDLARQNRIACIRGDLTSETDLPKAMDLLTAQKAPLSVIDISNSHYYFSEPSTRYWFLEILKRLPNPEKTQLLFTDGTAPAHRDGFIVPRFEDGWYYYGVTVKKLLTRVESEFHLQRGYLVAALNQSDRFSNEAGPHDQFMIPICNQLLK